MFAMNDVLNALGAKNIVFFGDNKFLVNALRNKCIDVKYVTEKNQIHSLFPILNYDIIIEETFLAESIDLFYDLLAPCQRNVLVVLNESGNALVKLKIENQGTLDRKFLNAGYMLHESNMTCDVYNYRETKLFNICSLYRKISNANLAKYPEEFLLENRELHMDMLREPGARADSHVVRYFLASSFIKKGDAVLDCACGLGYGSSIMARNSLGRSYLGIDIEPSSIEYANNMYAIDHRLKFNIADAQDLQCIGDDEIDFICSFETIEHVPNYQVLLEEYFRVLTPGGRMIISAPNMWVDETGKDPNPYHFHEFDYEKLTTCLVRQGFLLEKSYLHTAPGGPTNFFAKRVLIDVALGAENVRTEISDWITLIVVKSPFSSSVKQYNYSAYNDPPKNYTCTNFNDFYKTPWIYRSLIQIGERVSNPTLLNDLIDFGLSDSVHDKDEYADYGACLTVKGYLLLQDISVDDTADYIAKVSHFINTDITRDNIHIYRWKISAAFVAGKIAMRQECKDKVTEFFNYIVNSSPEKFSPLLMTKKLKVLFYLGTYSLQSANIEQAKEHFESAIKCGYQAITADGLNSFGSIKNPNSFGFSELAEISDMTQQCTIALNEINMFNINPGYYWSKIDVKRFGLFSYARYLEIENALLKL